MWRMRVRQMEIFKTFLIFFSLCLFHSALTKTYSMCHGNLPPVKYVAQNSNVTVPCPTLSGMEMDFKLYKGPDEVTSNHVNITNTLVNKHYDFPAHLSVNFTDNSANFILFSVTMNITALYTCEAEKNFPPPLVKVEQTPQTIVFVQETPRKQPCQHVSYLVLWLVLGGITIYGLAMSCMVLMLLIKMSQIDSQFYGLKNTKVRENRQKWQGVQHPTLQGFYTDTVAWSCLTARQTLAKTSTIQIIISNSNAEKSFSCFLR